MSTAQRNSGGERRRRAGKKTVLTSRGHAGSPPMLESATVGQPDSLCQVEVGQTVNTAEGSEEAGTADKSMNGGECLQEPPGLKVAYEIALKKMEFLDRTYDNLNTRAGAIFGFASFVVANSLAASTELAKVSELRIGQYHFKQPVQFASAASLPLLFAVFFLMVIQCHRSYRLQTHPILPKLDVFYRKYGHMPEWFAREQMLGEIHGACCEKSGILQRKATSLQWALLFLLLEVFLMLVMLALPRLCR